MEEPFSTPDRLIDLPAPRGESLASRVSRYTRRHWGRLAIFAGVAVTVGHTLGGLAGAWEFVRFLRGHPATASSDASSRPFRSFVVMPLVARLAQPEEEQLAQALTHQLTKATAQGFRDGLVVSNGMAEHVKKRTDNPRDVGRELNVRYVLSGTLTKTGAIRELSAELIDSLDGAQVWSGRVPFDEQKSVEAITTIRNGVRNAVLDSTEKEIMTLPKEKKLAWDLVIRSWNLGDSIAEMRQVEKLNEEALRLDPVLLPALLTLAQVLQLRSQHEPEKHDELTRRVDDLSMQAVRIAPNDARAWTTRQMAHRLQQNWNAAFEANDQAMRLDPFRPQTVYRRAGLLVYAGRPAEALPVIDRAVHLDPSDQAEAMIWRCVVFVQLARYREALPECEKGAAAFTFWTMFALAASAAAEVGDKEKASKWKRKMMEANPRVSIAYVRTIRDSENPDFKAQRENFISGLRKAGVPEK